MKVARLQVIRWIYCVPISDRESEQQTLRLWYKDVWCRYTKYENIIGLDEVMPSGSSSDASKALGFDKETIKKKIKDLLKK